MPSWTLCEKPTGKRPCFSRGSPEICCCWTICRWPMDAHHTRVIARYWLPWPTRAPERQKKLKQVKRHHLGRFQSSYEHHNYWFQAITAAASSLAVADGEPCLQCVARDQFGRAV